MDWITHEEDVWFDFRGSEPDQLTTGRFYRGTVDGFADFGVFVDLAPGVTGLLHRSELDRRLESLDWDPGDTVFVQVKNVRDNGNVDLAWSIRQSEAEFRGARIDDPDGDPEGEPIENGAADDDGGPVRRRVGGESDGRAADEPTEPTEPTDEHGGDDGSAADATDGRTGDEADREASPSPSPSGERERVPVGELSDRVGDDVRIEVEVAEIRQTGGPTIFTVRDGTGEVEVAAFVEAGVRAYPEVDVGDAVRIDGEVERRRGELQVETEALAVLADEAATAVTDRLTAALDDRAEPATTEPLTSDGPAAAATEAVGEAARAIRRAVFDERPIVVRHAATADGYVAGAAIERATLPLVRDEHDAADAEYHYFDRRPLEEPVYGMEAATNDVTRMLSDRERFDEQLPLVVLAGVGNTEESLDGLSLLGIYEAERLVLDATPADDAVAETVETLVDPSRAGADPAALTTGALAADVAVAVDDGVRDDLAHLPATSYWTDPPAAYVDLAAEAGYDEADCRRRREAVALEAYYQSYEDKRELVRDLLFDDAPAPATRRGEAADREAGDLVEHVSEQFREKVTTEVETAEVNMERRDAGGIGIAVLDADAYAHRFDFPPTPLLVDELHRRNRGENGVFVTVGLGTDELYVRSTADVDVRAAAERAADRAPDAGITAAGVREGRIEFLSGEREAVVESVIRAVVEQLA
jgi:RecJ-like exonuclease